MEAFLAYNLKLSGCFLLFYLLYKGVFCRNTFHRMNRMVLISAHLVILFIPLISFTTGQSTGMPEIIGVYETFLPQPFSEPTEAVSSQPAFDPMRIAVVVYMIGILFFTCRYLYFIIRIIFLIRAGEKIRLDSGIVLIICEKNIIPFSWMHYIMLSRTDAGENCHAILLHEQTHIKCLHSVDLIIANIFAIIQWYNPFIWLIKSELQDIHEYEADEAALHSGVGAKQYQLLLIERAVGSSCFNSITNGFNHSKLKKRINMMMKKKNSRWSRLKYLSILPIAALAVALFACREVSNKTDEASATDVSDLVSEFEPNPDVMPKFIGEYGGNIIEYLGYELRYPEEAIKAGANIRVFFDFIVEKDGSVNKIDWVATHVSGKDWKNPDVIAAKKACKKAAYEIVASTSGKWKPGLKNNEPVRCEMSLPVWFKFR